MGPDRNAPIFSSLLYLHFASKCPIQSLGFQNPLHGHGHWSMPPLERWLWTPHLTVHSVPPDGSPIVISSFTRPENRRCSPFSCSTGLLISINNTLSTPWFTQRPRSCPWFLSLPHLHIQTISKATGFQMTQSSPSMDLLSAFASTTESARLR